MKYLLLIVTIFVFGCKNSIQEEDTNHTNEASQHQSNLVLVFGSIFPSGNKIVFSKDGDIFITEKTQPQLWSEPIKIKGTINTVFEESNPAVSPDGKRIYFVSNRDGGVGGKDIYVAHKLADKEWGEIINLGPVVNTLLDEDMPYLSKDGLRFYFVSKSHQSKGGYDMFMSNMLQNGMSIVESMTDVNTEQDDMLYLYFLQEGYAIKTDSIANINNLIVVNTSFSELNEDIELTTYDTTTKQVSVAEVKSFLKGDISYQEFLKIFGNEKLEGIYYEIQLAAGSGELKIKDEVLQLGAIKKRKVSDDLFRYSLGEYQTLLEVDTIQKQVQAFGFTNAFVTYYQNNEKTSLTQLLKNYIATNEVGN